VRATSGDPVDQPDAVHRERWNGSVRERLNGRTRKTHGCAQEAETWNALFSLVLFE
jgi:hypothetical protein